MKAKFRISLLVVSVQLFAIVASDAQWVQTSLDSVGVTLATNGTFLFAGSSKGVCRSSDNGITWEVVNNGLDIQANGLTGVTLAVAQTHVVAGINQFPFGTDRGVIFISTNNGLNWTRTSLDSVWIESLAFNGTFLFVGTADKGIFKSSDFGTSWSNVGLMDTAVFALAFSNVNIIAGTYRGVFVSSNNGSSWVQSNLDTNNIGSFATIGTYVFTAAYEPGFSDSKIPRGVLRSSDNGLTWVRAGLDSFLVSCFAVSANNLFAGTESDGVHNGNIFRSTNNGTSWTAVSTGLGATSVWSLVVSNQSLFAGTTEGVWQRPLSEMAQNVTVLDTVYTQPGYPDGALTATIFVPNPSLAKGIGIILGRYTNATRLTSKVWCDTLAARGYLAMTIDYGNLDTSVYPKPQRAFKTAVEFLRKNTLRFGLTKNKIVGFGQSQGSLIWGQTMIWDNDDAFFGTDLSVNDSLDAAVLLYGAYDMFNNLLPIQNTILAAHFSPDPSLRGTKGQCITNTSNITTPVLLVHGTNDATVNIVHSRMLYDSLRTHGNRVKLIEFNGASHVFDIVADGPFTSLGLMAKDSVLAWLEEKVVTSVSQLDVHLPRQFVLQQNFPNPFNPSTEIEFSLLQRSYVTLTVWNLLGEEVATLVSEELSAGSYSTRWDAAGLPSGVYLYRLQAGKFVETKKLLLLR